MLVPKHLFGLLCIVALLAAPSANAGASTDSRNETATSAKKGKAKAKGKRCKKGYVPKTTQKNGKKVKVCRKRPGKGKGGKDAGGTGTTPSGGLFEAPGRTLEGEAAKPFLEKYLLNSTFTDCPTGWPSCGGFENRYSHSADNTFYKCLLRPTSGSDVKSVGEYGVSNARVNPDGSWIFQEVVSWYGNLTSFEWSVSTSGVVDGAEQSHSGGAPEKIGPLQYVGGVAKDCSY